MLEVQFTGLADLEKALQELAPKVQKNAIRGALRAGQKVILQAVKLAAPVGPPSFGNRKYGLQAGDLAKSARISIRARNGDLVASVKVGNSRVWYAHLVEFGTAAHVIAAQPGHALNVNGRDVKRVLHPGAQKKPFMRPVFDSTTNQQGALEAFAAYMRKRVDAELAPDPAETNG